MRVVNVSLSYLFQISINKWKTFVEISYLDFYSCEFGSEGLIIDPFPPRDSYCFLLCLVLCPESLAFLLPGHAGCHTCNCRQPPVREVGWRPRASGWVALHSQLVSYHCQFSGLVCLSLSCFWLPLDRSWDLSRELLLHLLWWCLLCPWLCYKKANVFGLSHNWNSISLF